MKLVRMKKWELYDLAKDRSETNNVIKQFPEVAKDLEAQWNVWYKECTGVDFKEAEKTAKAEKKKKKEKKAVR